MSGVINCSGVKMLGNRFYALVGVISPLIALICIALSIILSPWFSWESNALSDLGHSARSGVAPLFNFGLILTGFLTIFYSITCFKNHAKFTSYFLVLTGLTLQLVATFDEIYDFIHFLVSVLFFLSLTFTSLSYFIEKKSILAITAFIISTISWILFWQEIYIAGIAVPEIISAITTIPWIIMSAFRLYFIK